MGEQRSQEAIVSQILDGRAGQQLRSAAARGALPLPRATLVRLYVALRDDEDESVRTEAQTSLDDLAHSAILEVLEDEECAPDVLDFFSQQGTKDEAIAQRIAFHKAVPANALAALATAGNAGVIELVLTNQERLLSQPQLLDRLSMNPALRPGQRGQILELLERASRVRPRGEEDDPEGDEDRLSAEVEEAARLLQVDVGELFAASEILDGDEFEQAEDPNVRTAYRKILTLNVAQKAILAMRGGREERIILVRDTNKIVALGVLRNGRITEEDIEFIARMRSVSDEVLRQIGQNRDWLKSYLVVTALVNNPRTPPGVSTNLVARMQNQDLKRIAGNHDVPELIRRMAKRTLDLRTQKLQGGGKRR